MKWEYYGQSTWKFNKSVSINLNKTGKSTNEGTACQTSQT